MAGLVWFCSALFFEFLGPFNLFSEPLRLMLVELGFWALIAIAEDLILTAPERIARIAARAHRLRILAPPLPLPLFSVQLVRRAGSDDAALRWLRGRIVDAAAMIASAPAPGTR
jgi:hypothetical protein